MTEKEKRTILDMRAAGKQYKEISSELGIEISALKLFVHRQKHYDVSRCEQCMKVLLNDQDIHDLAVEIATLTRTQQRGRGMRMA